MPLFVEGSPDAVEKISVSTKIDHWLDQYPSLKERSRELAHHPPRQLSSADKVLYVTQREFATLRRHGSNVNYIGSDDATTCHILILYDEQGTAVSVGHFDGTAVEEGVQDMLDEITDIMSSSGQSGNEMKRKVIYAHIAGGFVDQRGDSEKLFRKLINCFCSVQQSISLLTACVYNLNTTYSAHKTLASPLVYGFGMEIASLDVYPCSFCYRGPDEVMRHARNFSSVPGMINCFDFTNNTCVITAFDCVPFPGAEVVSQLTDDDVLKFLSTSPHCEPPNFVGEVRKAVQFLIDFYGKALFKDGNPRVYEISREGIWKLR